MIRFDDISKLTSTFNIAGCSDFTNKIDGFNPSLTITSEIIPKYEGDFRYKNQSLNLLLTEAVKNQISAKKTNSSSDQKAKQTYQEKEKSKAEQAMKEYEVEQRSKEIRQKNTTQQTKDPVIQTYDNVEKQIKNIVADRDRRIDEESRKEDEQIEREKAERERRKRQEEIASKQRQLDWDKRIEFAKPYKNAVYTVETFLKEVADNFPEINELKKNKGRNVTVFGIAYMKTGIHFLTWDKRLREENLPAISYYIIGPISIPSSQVPYRDKFQLYTQFKEFLPDYNGIYLHAAQDDRDILAEFTKLCEEESYDDNITVNYTVFSSEKITKEYKAYLNNVRIKNVEKDLYQKVYNEYNIKAFKDFIVKYPNSEYRNLAQKCIDSIDVKSTNSKTETKVEIKSTVVTELKNVNKNFKKIIEETTIRITNQELPFQINQFEENILEVQKVLNSIVMDYYVSNTSVSIQGGFPCYQKNFIEKFTIPNFTKEEINILKSLTDKMEIDEFLIEKYQINLPVPNLVE